MLRQKKKKKKRGSKPHRVDKQTRINIYASFLMTLITVAVFGRADVSCSAWFVVTERTVKGKRRVEKWESIIIPTPSSVSL